MQTGTRLTLIQAFCAESGRVWDPSSFDTMLECFRYVPTDELKEFEHRIMTMPYQQFLKTVYWGIIRGKMLGWEGARCASCGSDKALNIHHLSYDHRGSEYNHLDDLQILCRFCHQKTHGLESAKSLIIRGGIDFKSMAQVIKENTP